MATLDPESPMTLPSITLAEGAGAAPGRYVDAELAQKLAENLERLTWQVLYGKAYDAANAAVQADQFLSDLRGAAQV